MCAALIKGDLPVMPNVNRPHHLTQAVDWSPQAAEMPAQWQQVPLVFARHAMVSSHVQACFVHVPNA